MKLNKQTKKKHKNKTKLEKTAEDTGRKFFKRPSVYLFAFPQKRLVQSSLEFRIALKAFIVPKLILTCDKDCFLYSVECDIQQLFIKAKCCKT